MQIKEMMTRLAGGISADCTVQEAVEKMKALGISALPICGEEDRLVGLLSDRDIAVRVLAGGHDPAHCKVRAAMTPEVVSCFEDDSLEDLAQLGPDTLTQQVPVLDRDSRLVGIIAVRVSGSPSSVDVRIPCR